MWFMCWFLTLTACDAAAACRSDHMPVADGFSAATFTTAYAHTGTDQS